MYQENQGNHGQNQADHGQNQANQGWDKESSIFSTMIYRIKGFPD